jgi:TonB family protein
MPASYRPRLTLQPVAAILFLSLCGAALAQETPAGPPYRVGGEVTRPEKIAGDPPQYTELARKARISGVVIVEAVINEQGNVENARVLKGLPMGLDQSALDAIKTWMFKPATLHGKPVPVYYVLTVSFQVQTDLSFGPRFAAFQQKNPDFAASMATRRYDEALTLLDRWAAERPQDSELHLARTYALQGQGHYEEAWKEAQAYDGPGADELLYFFSVNAGNAAYSEQDSAERSDLVEMGLQAIERVVAVRPDDIDTLSIQSGLLQHKASMLSDDNEDAAAIRGEAIRLQTRIDELRAKKGGLTFPEKVSGETTELTEMARKAGLPGPITIEAVIDEQGNVVNARVIEKLATELEQKALETIRAWKFKPATAGGKPIRMSYTLKVSF